MCVYVGFNFKHLIQFTRGFGKEIYHFFCILHAEIDLIPCVKPYRQGHKTPFFIKNVRISI